MKLLLNYKKNGYFFALIARNGQNAIFHGSKPGSSADNYEAIQIQETLAGSRIVRDSKTGTESTITWEAHERPPSDAEWGRLGFTFNKLEDARAWMLAMPQPKEAAQP